MRLEKSFFERPPEVVAKELIGKKLHHQLLDGTILEGLIVETEAYLAERDAAAHNARGQTNANRALFDDAGTLYIHPMRAYVGMDIVTEKKGVPSSVLIRALQPLAGVEIMQENIGQTDETKLCNGPSKLCKAMGITKAYNGFSVCEAKSRLYVEDTKQNMPVTKGERIGVTKNQSAPLRFFLQNSPYVSK
ncbi:MAG: DNA-3-methyladenine glycosylase [Alphaproteobacteria bacterium CG_4_10_14_0_8_um_filter_53_9]|nr:MAG: DNA-3-methyladenine glycosylase [Alphaproteobacteria bacterium CG_4_10_14_0_8_um_filter_53_9]